MKLWRNWSGSVSSTPAEYYEPSTLDDIVAIVQRCRAEGKGIRVVGSGHSFSPLVATDSVLLSLDRYTGLERVDREACTATVKAGTKLKALGELLFSHGLAQENLGDINEQSIAGAISTGTHGTGIAFGSISTQVIELTIVTGNGEVVTCSETENRLLFKSAQVSLGALGIIVSVTLRLIPAYALKIDIKKKPLTECLANLNSYNRDNRHFEFHFLPYTDTVQAKFTNLSNEKPAGKNLVRLFNEYALENGALWLLSAFNRQFPQMSERVCKTMAALVTDASGVSHAHEIFATARFVKFQEMEYNLPAEHFKSALRELDEMIRRERIQVHIPIECRFVHKDDIPLSPAYGRSSAYIAIHMFKGMPYQRYFELAEEIFKRYEGRPHWGKMHTCTAPELRMLYPEWNAFQLQRSLHDPDRLFSSPYIRTILG
jgi:FAD-linked oxidoreductase